MAAGNIEGLVKERFDDDGKFPNSRLPLLLYRAAVAPEKATPEAFEALFLANDWPPQWRDSIFTYHHFHSTAHEVLGIAAGEATLTLGGPMGRQFTVQAGDVIVIPAGVGHQRISASPDFLVVGGYPPGQEADLHKGHRRHRPKLDENIARVPLPRTDPVGGDSGGVISDWG